MKITITIKQSGKKNKVVALSLLSDKPLIDLKKLWEAKSLMNEVLAPHIMFDVDAEDK